MEGRELSSPCSTGAPCPFIITPSYMYSKTGQRGISAMLSVNNHYFVRTNGEHFNTDNHACVKLPFKNIGWKRTKSRIHWNGSSLYDEYRELETYLTCRTFFVNLRESIYDSMLMSVWVSLWEFLWLFFFKPILRTWSKNGDIFLIMCVHHPSAINCMQICILSIYFISGGCRIVTVGTSSLIKIELRCQIRLKFRWGIRK